MPVDAYEATPEAWARIGEAVRDRRIELGLKIQQVTANEDIGSTVWSQVENGHPENNRLSYAKMGAICRALGWTHGSIKRLAVGGEPVPTTTQSEELEIQARLWRIEEVVQGLMARFELLESGLQRLAAASPYEQGGDRDDRASG